MKKLLSLLLAFTFLAGFAQTDSEDKKKGLKRISQNRNANTFHFVNPVVDIPDIEFDFNMADIEIEIPEMDFEIELPNMEFEFNHQYDFGFDADFEVDMEGFEFDMDGFEKNMKSMEVQLEQMMQNLEQLEKVIVEED